MLYVTCASSGTLHLASCALKLTPFYHLCLARAFRISKKAVITVILGFCIPPGLSGWASTSYMFFSCMSWTRSIFFTMYVSYHSGFISSSLEWTILEAGGDNVSNQPSSLLWNSPLSSVVSHGILTSTDLTDRSSLFWTPRLESCCLPSSFLSVSWSPPSHGPCSQNLQPVLHCF